MLSEARLKFLEKTISAKGTTKKLVLHWEGFFSLWLGLWSFSLSVCAVNTISKDYAKLVKVPKTWAK